MSKTPQCPICANVKPSGTFQTHPMENSPLKKFRVQTNLSNGDRIIHGEYDSIDMARACVCGIKNAIILSREYAQTP